MQRNMRLSAFGRRQQMERWFPYHSCTEKMSLRKMEPIRCFCMRMVLTDPMSILISIALLLVYWTGDLFMLLLTSAAARNWEENGLKTEDCFTKKILLLILLTAASFS